MKRFPLQLRQVCVRDVAIKAAETAEFAGSTNISADPSFGRGGDDTSIWQVTLNVKFKAGDTDERPLQYSGHIDLLGIFQVEPTDMLEDAVLRMISINAPAMLYATARDILANLSARGPHGVFLLPTVAFTDFTIKPLDQVPGKLAEEVPVRKPRKHLREGSGRPSHTARAR